MILAPRVIQVTDPHTVSETELLARLDRSRRLAADVRRRIAVQLRAPRATARELLGLGSSLRQRTSELGISLLVNDRLDLAYALRADGVHLGRHSVAVADARRLLGADGWLSVACHDVAEVVRAAAAGADAALLSPIFASPGKGEPLGLGAVGAARAAVQDGPAVSIYALGGVTGQRAAACIAAGADGVAGIRADLIRCMPALMAVLTR